MMNSQKEATAAVKQQKDTLSMTADQYAINGMQACLPEGCPLPFTTVESAKFIRKGVAVAQVKMFDGRTGTLQVSSVSYGSNYSGWCLQWQELPGGDINWNGK